MTLKRTVLFLLSNLLPGLIFAQLGLEGQVMDQNKESLAFVNITMNGNDSQGVIADIDGRFYIGNEEEIETLTFSYVGYETLDYKISEDDKKEGNIIIVQLKPSDFGLEEVVVKAGDNPAHRIIRKAVRNRKKNNHEWLSSYQCEVYSKMNFGYVMTDSSKYASALGALKTENESKSKEAMERKIGFFDIHLFVSEVVSERKFKFPETVKNKLLHNRVSGMKKMDFSILNSFQQFTFYDDFVRFADQEFVNPISKGSTQLYFFNTEDTLYQVTDTIFLISFRPKKNKSFEGLKGMVYINTNGYAIQNVLAEPADADKISWKLEHQYVFLETGNWFPQQLNFEVIMPDPQMDFADIRMRQKSYISKVLINPQFTFRDMKDDYIALRGDIISREDSIWSEHRVEPLSVKEIMTYEVVDSLGDKVPLDGIMKGLLSFSTGRLSLRGIDVVWKDVLRVNNFEKLRLGLGLQTNKDFSRYVSLGANAGYGFRDKALKYGGNVIVDVIPDDILEIKYAFRNDIMEPGLFSFSLQDDVFIGRNIYAQVMDQEIRHSLSLQSRYQFLRTSISLEKTKLKPLYPYTFGDGTSTEQPRFHFTELSIHMRYAFGENNDWFMGTKVAAKTKYPIVLFGYTKGFQGTLGGKFDYHKFSLAIEQKFNTRFVGETNYRIEGGLIRNDIPYSKLFLGSGAGGFYSFIGLDNTFQTMKNYEFAANQFVNIYLEHDFGNILVRHKYSRPRLVVLHNMGYGILEKPAVHHFPNESVITNQDWSKGYFESGLGLDNLVVIPLLRTMNLGLGARIYYRYGMYQLEKQKDNIAIRGSISIVF